jgi:hypothetical protein
MTPSDPSDCRSPGARRARVTPPDERLLNALDLARRVNALLESLAAESQEHGAVSTHSTRMASALALSLVDELEALVHSDGSARFA